MKFYYVILVLLIVGVACKKDDTSVVTNIEDPIYIPDCNSPIDDKVFIEGNRKFLWGGTEDSWHFDITGWELNECQLHYGLGREAFKALISSEYISVADASAEYSANDRFMIVFTEQDPLAYSIRVLTTHEVINEVADNNPIMVAYCVLADLAAVYTRIYCGQEFTFALSGYTYFDPDVWNGLDGFVMWDRETESLWWPLIDKAVSGLMYEKNVFMQKYDETKWKEITWSNIVSDHPHALVLRAGQTMPIPTNWPGYSSSDLSCP